MNALLIGDINASSLFALFRTLTSMSATRRMEELTMAMS